MSTTTTREVTVAELSKYGFKEGDTYVNWSKNCEEKCKGLVVPGGTYKMDVYTADSGKMYVNSVYGPVGAPVTAKAAVTPKVTPAVKSAYTPKAKASDSGLSKDEWRLKDERISRQGCVQVAVQVAGTFEEAVILADKMLEYVNRNTPH